MSSNVDDPGLMRTLDSPQCKCRPLAQTYWVNNSVKLGFDVGAGVGQLALAVFLEPLKPIKIVHVPRYRPPVIWLLQLRLLRYDIDLRSVLGEDGGCGPSLSTEIQPKTVQAQTTVSTRSNDHPWRIRYPCPRLCRIRRDYGI